MGLVSSLYRLTPPTTSHETRREMEGRLRRLLVRLIREHGQDAVIDQIEAYKVPAHLDDAKAWLKRTAWTIRTSRD